MPTDPLTDHEARLRLLEHDSLEAKWKLVELMQWKGECNTLVTDLATWRRDNERAARAMQQGISRREKQLAGLLVFLSPILSIVVAHYLK